MKFKGSESPKIYILDYHNNPEEFMQEYPLSGQRGEFVTSLLGSFGLLDKVRVGNPEIQGKMIVEDDIVEKDPELIIGFGSHAVSDYINSRQKITELSGNIFDIKIKDKEYKLLILISPSYVLKKIDDSELSLRFSKDLYKAKQIIDGQYIDILKEKIVKSAHSFDEFKELYENNLKDINEIGYDIETNARPAMMRDSRIIGFSIGSKDFGIYVSIDSIDFHMSKDEEDKIWDYLINEIFEKKDKLIIHNTMYERPYTYYCKNYEISFEKAHDTLVMARLLKSPKETAGLKYQAQKYLFYPDWESDLGRYISGFRGLVERIGLGPKKFNDFYEKIRTNQINIFDETAVTSDSSFTSLASLDQEEILDIINCCKTVLVDIYSEDEIEELGRLIQEKVVETVDLGGVRDSTIPYNYVPDRVLSRYGAIDAIATADLKDYFFGIMDKESTKEVDLHKGYHNWLEHIYVAYIMERNGMYWNDDLAQRDRDFLSKQAYQCLKELLLSPCFDQFIIPVEEWRYRPIIFSDYLPMIPVSQGFEVIYSRDTNSYVLKKDGKRIQKGRINEIQIPNNFKNQYEKIVRELFYDEINSSKDFKDLKELYNPGSPTSSDIPRKIFVDEYLQMGGRINELHTLSISPSFEKIKDKIPYLDQKFLTTANYCCNVDLLKEQFGDNWAYNRKLFYEGFWNLYNSQKGFVTTPEIRRILDNKCPVEIESFDDNGVITIFDNLVVQGVDPDDSSTYNDKFKWLINFRIFKKAIKIISTYIDGSTGREAVTIVNKKDLDNGCHKTYRERFYAEGTARDGEGYLLMSKWGPNTAETGRWRSNFHTLPWTSPVKKYYESRFVGGCTCSPDYCLTGDTKIRLLDGRQISLEELYNSGETSFDVYSYDIDANKVVPGKAHDLRITKRTKEIYEIYLDNGSVIRCTDNHPFLSFDKEYIKARDLKIGQSLQPCNFREISHINNNLIKEDLIKETYVKIVLTGILVSPATWDNRLKELGLYVKGCIGNSLLNVKRVYGSFQNLVLEFKDQLPEAWTNEVLFRSDFEDKFGRIKSQTYKTYFNNFESLGLKVTEDSWNSCLDLLSNARSVDGKKVIDKCHKPYLSALKRVGLTFDDLKRYSRENHRVVDIKIISLSEEIPVYDLEVDQYHDFLICTGNDSGIFVHNSTMEVRTLAAISKDQNMLDLFARGEDFHTNTASSIFRKPKDEITPTERRFSKTGTFSILYGSTVESFANKYCQGDVSYAKQIYDGFYNAYPGAKHWMDERHKEVMRDHRISLNLSDRFIPIVPEGDNVGAINAMLRKSINYGIQGMSADITGCVIFDLQKYIEEHNLKSLVFMYVHDSIEVDIYPFEMLEFFQYLKVLLNEAPRRRMGLISEAEIALGKSLGDEIELTELIVSDDKASGILKLKGYKDEIDETVENWKKVYKTVEVSDEEYKDVYTSVNELFMLKKAYSFTVGTHRKKGTCTVKIDYYK